MFEAMKLSNVRSVIASGNVLFETRSSDAAALETRIETALRKSLGYDVETFLRTPEELDALAAHDPFAANDPVLDGHKVHVLFTRSAVTAAEKKQVLALATHYDDFAVFGREIYWRTRGNSSDSGLFEHGSIVVEPFTQVYALCCLHRSRCSHAATERLPCALLFH